MICCVHIPHVLLTVLLLVLSLSCCAAAIVLLGRAPPSVAAFLLRKMSALRWRSADVTAACAQNVLLCCFQIVVLQGSNECGGMMVKTEATIRPSAFCANDMVDCCCRISCCRHIPSFRDIASAEAFYGIFPTSSAAYLCCLFVLNCRVPPSVAAYWSTRTSKQK